MLKHVKAAQPVTLGFLPAHRPVFSKEASVRERKKIENRLSELGITYVGLDWLNADGLLYDPADAPAVAERFAREGVDALFAAHCNFGTELAVGRVCSALGKPVLLWGPRDDAPAADGLRERDTQCGLFATGKLLRRLGLPFTYIVNSSVDDPVFERGLDVFLRAVNTARCVKGARIGQIDTRPGPFTSVVCNEGELLERFGVEVVPVALDTLAAEVKRTEGSEEAAQEAESFKSRVSVEGISEDMLRRLAALKLALKRWAEDEALDGIAIQCWEAMQGSLGICPCFVNGELTDLGVPVACETDINGAITAIALQAAAMCQSATFFADLTIRHPDNDNAELLWHCGPFPLSLADPDSPRIMSGHYIMPNREPAVGNWRIRGGEFTLARFDGDHGVYSMMMGHARSCDGPFTRGTYVWVEVGDWPAWEERLVCGPYIHHVTGVHGKLAPALYEACKYIGIAPDPIEPSEAEIRAFLRGKDM